MNLDLHYVLLRDSEYVKNVFNVENMESSVNDKMINVYTWYICPEPISFVHIDRNVMITPVFEI